MVDDVAVCVDDGLFEPHHVDEEPDQGAGIVRAQGGPDLGCRGRIAHASDHVGSLLAVTWKFRNSCAIQLVGDSPVNCCQSRIRCAWSK